VFCYQKERLRVVGSENDGAFWGLPLLLGSQQPPRARLVSGKRGLTPPSVLYCYVRDSGTEPHSEGGYIVKPQIISAQGDQNLGVFTGAGLSFGDCIFLSQKSVTFSEKNKSLPRV